MNFSPEYVGTLIIRPLRYLFEHYAPDELKWTDNEKTSGIEIDSVNNFHKKAIQKKPRILITRGQYQVQPVGLTDNLVQGFGALETKGRHQTKNMFLIDGVAQIMVQARQEGTCEKVVNLVQHFLAWTGPMIADTYGFKKTFLPMAISPCVPYKEDTEIFSCTINIPYTKEEHWMVNSGDEIKIKAFLLNLTNETS